MKTLLFSLLPIFIVPLMSFVGESELFGILVAVIAFFLVKLVNKQEEINRKLDTVLLQQTRHEMKLEHLEERLTELELEFKSTFK